MSDSINYDELDKAVNAAITAREKVKSQPKPAQARPQSAPKKPASRGLYMDFAPRTSSPRLVSRVATQTRVVTVRPTAPRVAANPAAKAAQLASHPVKAPVKRPAQAPALKTMVTKKTTTTVRPVTKPIAPARPVATPIAKPAPVAHAAAPARPATKPAAPSAPNANNYSLGGRSPFLNPDAKVEKRPLGANIPETSASALRSTRNVYSHKNPLKDSKNIEKHVVTESPKKKAGWLWTLIVIGVIAAGGALGYLAYLIVFKH